MSELKEIGIRWEENGELHFSHVYLKYEADKVIAELEDKLRHYPMMVALLESDRKEIAELKDKLQAADKRIENLFNSASRIMLAQDRVNDNKFAELRHQKYKRCLAMANSCQEAICYWDNVKYTYFKGEAYCFRKLKQSGRWGQIWLAIAEKFKEAK